MTGSGFSGRLGLVTGAASGIGQKTALALARAGADLVICDVNEIGLRETQGLIEAAGRRAEAYVVDVSSREAMAQLADRVHAAHGAVDILINNAGVGLGGGLLDTPLEQWDWLLSINLMGVLHGCHFFVPRMVERGRGHVVNVSSIAGCVAPAALAAYATSKFAVFGLSEALREELRPKGIGVTTLCPGVVDTGIVRSARMMGDLGAQRDHVAELYRRRGYGPERVAARILKAIERNEAVVPVTPEAWLLYLLKRLSPALSTLVMRKMDELGRRGT